MPKSDPREIADRLVADITDTVHRRFQPRRGELVPPRLTGRCKVPGLSPGEKVVDRADELLEDATTEWPEAVEAEVYLDLLEERGQWFVEWVVDTTEGDDEDEDIAGDGADQKSADRGTTD